MSQPEIHTPISSEEIAKTFDEVETPIDLSGHSPEDWVNLVIFWLMCGCVFLQFFTRYVLNNSFAWTEEVAIFCLVAVVFLGAAMCVRTSRHIHVDFLYRYLRGTPGRVMSTFVDLLRIVVFAYLAWLVWRYKSIIPDEQMTTDRLPEMALLHDGAHLVRADDALEHEGHLGQLAARLFGARAPRAFDGSEGNS